MGKQLRARVKRKRRKLYIKRQKERIRKLVAMKKS